MQSRSATPLAVGLSVVLLLASGCTGHDPAEGRHSAATASPLQPATPSPTGTPDRDDLLAALQRAQSGPFRYTVDSDLPEGGKVQAAGALDPGGKLLDLTHTVTGRPNGGTSHRVVVGNDHYLQQTGGTWVHLDMSRVSKDNHLTYFDMTDPTGLAVFITTITSAQRTGPHAYSGRFNPYRTTAGRDFLPIGAPAITMIGGGTAPFTITTDEQGQVASIHIELSQSKGPTLVMTTTLTGHGQPLSISAPANFAEADDMYYRP